MRGPGSELMDERDDGSLPPAIARYAQAPSALERRARAYFERRTNASGEPPLEDGDRRQLAGIRNRAVLMAALSGTLSGLLIGGLEIYLRLGVIQGSEDRGLLEDPGIWAGFYAFVGVLTVIEVIYLYWVALNAVSRTREVVGIAIRHRHASELAETGLARGALEIPNPHTEIYGVDPYELIPRWKLLVWNLLYRTKVGATGVILRVLMRRVFSRAVLRSYIPLLAVPLYAGWNAVIIWRVIAEARLRALGPFAVRQAVALAARGETGDARGKAVLHGTAEIIRRSGDAHPNYALLMSQLLPAIGEEDRDIAMDGRIGRAEIAALDEGERRDLIEFLTIVAVLAGRPNRAQVGFLTEIHEFAGVPFDTGRTAEIRRRLLDGRPLADG